MAFLNRTLIALLILFFYTGNNIARAQLWRYLNDSPENQKAADKALKKEAFSVITKKTVFCLERRHHRRGYNVFLLS